MIRHQALDLCRWHTQLANLLLQLNAQSLRSWNGGLQQAAHAVPVITPKPVVAPEVNVSVKDRIAALNQQGAGVKAGSEVSPLTIKRPPLKMVQR